MDDLLKKVSYLKGLSAGLGVDDATTEGKLLIKIIEVLGDFTEVIQETVEDQLTLEEYISFIDEDLFDVEDEIYGGYDDFDEGDYDGIYKDIDEFMELEGFAFEDDEDEDDEDEDIEDEE